jgi:hypothetical protein
VLGVAGNAAGIPARNPCWTELPLPKAGGAADGWDGSTGWAEEQAVAAIQAAMLNAHRHEETMVIVVTPAGR